MQAFKQMAQLKNHSLMHIAGVDIKEKESVSGRHWFVQAECETCKRTFANQKSLQCHIDAVHQKVSDFSNAIYCKVIMFLFHRRYIPYVLHFCMLMFCYRIVAILCDQNKQGYTNCQILNSWNISKQYYQDGWFCDS